MPAAIGLLELSSIASGFVAQDAIFKAADVELLMARTICPGKFIILIGGKVDSVKTSMKAGSDAAAGFIVDQLVIPNVDKRVFPALTGCVDIPEEYSRAVGVMETFSSVSIIQAADAAVKAANITLFRVHVAMAIGGKGFMLLCGDVASVKTAIAAGAAVIKEEGVLVNMEVISGASKELFREYV
ncbi:MAG: BMC domain-containing protein [Desulfobacterales bacterium]|nr:BMC domain-containing protein [Desulfobacterales bacterium]